MTTTSPTLRGLLRLAFPGRLVWVCGPQEGHPKLNWVVLAAEAVQEGDILLVKRLPQPWEAMIQARNQGAAAVVFLGDPPRPKSSIPPGLTVAALPEQQDAAQAQRLLLTAMINERAALMESGVRIHDQLARIEAEGQGLPGLVAAMAEFSGHGVLVQDKRLAVLAEQPSAELQEEWQGILDPLCRPESLPERMRDRKLAAQNEEPVEQPLVQGSTRLVTPIVVGGIARGYLSLIGATSSQDPLDTLIVKQGALVCGVELSRKKAVRETEKRLRGDLLNALLQENLSPQDAQLWAENMGIDPTRDHLAMRLTWQAAYPPSRRRLETLVNGEVSRLGLAVITRPLGTEVVCLCEVPPEAGRPEAILKLAQAIIDQGTRESPEAFVLCGVGAPSRQISEWRRSFRQAGQALELSRRFQERKALFFPDLSVYRLLIQLEQSPELGAFYKETLAPVLASEGARDLIRTLEVYFEHNGNLSKAAVALFIHRNTLIYRMERIAAISGLHLDDPDTRLAVQLALHIHRMIERAGP